MLTFGPRSTHVAALEEALRSAVVTPIFWKKPSSDPFEVFEDENAGWLEAEARERLTKTPVVYGITYWEEPPPTHPELVSGTAQAHCGGFLYIGRTGNAWNRLTEHRATLKAVCAGSNWNVHDFRMFFMPTEEAWETHSFEALAIQHLRPLFNDVFRGFGAGNSSDLKLYLHGATHLSDSDVERQSSIRGDVWSIVSDPDRKPKTLDFAW